MPLLHLSYYSCKVNESLPRDGPQGRRARSRPRAGIGARARAIFPPTPPPFPQVYVQDRMREFGAELARLMLEVGRGPFVFVRACACIGVWCPLKL